MGGHHSLNKANPFGERGCEDISNSRYEPVLMLEHLSFEGYTQSTYHVADMIPPSFPFSRSNFLSR
jgi:hypothetical protein